MNIRIGVLDEDISASSLEISYLYRYMAEKNTRLSVREYKSAAELLAEPKDALDILLLDTELPGMGGMEIARALRKKGCKAELLFITSVSRHAVESYDVHASAYMLKPVSYADFDARLTRAIAGVREETGKVVSISTENGFVAVPVKDILYMEVVKNNVFCHTKDGVYRTRATLKSEEEKLGNFAFVKINSCYLVNMSHIREVSGNTAFVGDVPLRISRARKTAFIKAFGEYSIRI